MDLGTLTLKITPENLDYDQFAISTKQPIVLKKNETNTYSWSGALSTLELKRDTIIALMNKEGFVWSGILSDVGIVANGKDNFTIDFTPVINAKGVCIPSTRYKGKKDRVEILEVEELLEDTGLEIEEVKETDIVQVEEVKKAETTEEVKVNEVVHEEPKKVEPSVIVLNGVPLRIKQ